MGHTDNFQAIILEWIYSVQPYQAWHKLLSENIRSFISNNGVKKLVTSC